MDSTTPANATEGVEARKVAVWGRLESRDDDTDERGKRRVQGEEEGIGTGASCRSAIGHFHRELVELQADRILIGHRVAPVSAWPLPAAGELRQRPGVELADRH